MGFLVAALGELRHRHIGDDEWSVVEAEELISGRTDTVSTPQFKEDTTDYVTYFTDPTQRFEWSVQWSMSVSGKDIDDFSLVKCPDGVEVEDEITFEFDELDSQ